ncbi:MAG: alpha/beta-type small acid-soluble spore protein [Firmicutes bacterium]|nr:alpha/beta-type small acid-soluble spore protein [Bacillota bacterium]
MPKSQVPGKLKAQSKSSPPKSSKKREPTPEELENLRLKVEAARALGLWEKVEAEGWGGLTAAESGRIGGLMTRIRFQLKRQAAQSENSPHA